MGSDYSVWFGEIRLRPSRRLSAVLAAAHLGALAVVLAMPLPIWAKAGSALGICASMVHAIHRHAGLRPSRAVLALKTTPTGLEAETRSGVRFATTVLGSSFVAPWLTVLHLAREDHRRPVFVVLLPDMLEPDAFRRLRVWLRWHQAAHGKAPDEVL